MKCLCGCMEYYVKEIRYLEKQDEYIYRFREGNITKELHNQLEFDSDVSYAAYCNDCGEDVELSEDEWLQFNNLYAELEGE